MNIIELEYEGQTYYLRNEQWFDCRGFVIPQYLQRELSNSYAKTIDLSDLSVVQLVEFADKFKKNEANVLAIRYYECFIYTLLS